MWTKSGMRLKSWLILPRLFLLPTPPSNPLIAPSNSLIGLAPPRTPSARVLHCAPAHAAEDWLAPVSTTGRLATVSTTRPSMQRFFPPPVFEAPRFSVSQCWCERVDCSWQHVSRLTTSAEIVQAIVCLQVPHNLTPPHLFVLTCWRLSWGGGCVIGRHPRQDRGDSICYMITPAR